MAKKGNIEAIYPLSPLQEGILFHNLYAPEDRAYHDHIVCRLKAPGGLDPTVFETAFGRVVARHQPLRTAFVWKLEGRPQQVVLRRLPVPVVELDLGALELADRDGQRSELLRRDRRRSYDLSKPPLMRIFLLRRSADEHDLVFSYHHVLLDAWSVPLLLRELLGFYGALSRGENLELAAPPPFRAYIDWLGRQDRSAAEAFWRRDLEGFAAATPLAFDGEPRGTGVDAGFDVCGAAPDPEATAALRSFARRHDLTLSTLVQGAWSLLLSRLSDQLDVLHGAVFSGRPAELPGVESMVGLLTNTLPVRVRLDPGARVVSWLGELQRHLFDLRQVQWSPLIEVQEASGVPHGEPLFESVVVFQNTPLDPAAGDPGAGDPAAGGAGLGVRLLDHDPRNNFPLTLMALPGPALSLRLIADRRRFLRTTVERRLALLEELLRALAAAGPESRVGELPAATAAERHQLLIEWNDSRAEVAAERGFLDLFAECALASSEAVAAVAGEDHLSYGALARRAGASAAVLRSRGVVPGEIVALLAERGVDFLGALLGILEAGCVYLPLDPGHPPRRLHRVLERSAAGAVVVSPELRPVLLSALEDIPGPDRPRILDLETPTGVPAWDRHRDIDADAYVIYTSGSTGVPKGAMIEHRGLVNHLLAKIGDLDLGPGDVVAQNASQCFDISVWQLLAPLAVGGRSEIVGDEEARDPNLLVRRVVAGRVTVLETVPSLLRALLDELDRRGGGSDAGSRGPGALRWLMPTGEELPPELARRWLETCPGVPLINAYGPTECSDDVSHHVLRRAPARGTPRISIGRPVRNLRLYVLDRRLRPLPLGVAGELSAGGVGVGRGYRREPARTAEIFVPDPYGSEPGARLYRTGDLARHRRGGELDFLGRLDHQVKIRGFRVELGEIEALVRRHPAVRSAAVVTRPVAEGADDLHLVAYVEPDPAHRSVGDGDADVPGPVERWRMVFDEVYRHGEGSERDRGINLRVWIDSTTGQPFSEEEILESVEDSVSRILALGGESVLELGCGTGLMMTRLLPHLASYRGTDVSPAALETARGQLAELGDAAGRARLEERPAHDLEGLPRAAHDVVVLNELVQYFPSAEYLVEVLEGAVERARPGGAVFVGGVRSLPLLGAFHLSVLLAQADPATTLAELRAGLRERLEAEKELVVDPRFFFAFARRSPAVTGVRLLLKGGCSLNEFTRYRYDAVLEIGSAAEVPETVPELDWTSGGWTLDKLRHRLTEAPGPLRVHGVPNARVGPEVAAWELVSDLDGADGTGLGPESTVAWLRSALDSSAIVTSALAGSAGGGVDPEEIRRLGEELGVGVEVTWAASGEADRFDVLVAGAPPARSWWQTPLELGAGTNRPRSETPEADLGPELRGHLRSHLPDYMVPALFVTLPALPLNRNGKIDRKALPTPRLAAPETGESAPRTPTEDLLAGIWCQVLRRERVAVDDAFFEIGGNSLLAIQVLSRVRKVFAVELPLRMLFETPTLRGLAREIDRGARGRAAPPIAPETRSGPQPLSFAQQRLWVVERMHPGSPAYNQPLATRLRGAIDPGALARVLDEIVRRHETLRTRFTMAGGEPVQVIDPARPMLLPRVDLGALEPAGREAELLRLAIEEAERPFDLERGPMLRATLVELEPREWTMLLTVHHIASDAWSMGLLFQEVTALYRAFSEGRRSPLAELPVQYADFARWQRRWLRGEVLEELLGYWRRQLHPPLPRVRPAPDHPPPEVPSVRGGNHYFALSEELSRRLAELAQREGATLFMVLLAAFETLLYRLTGQSDVIVGTDVANRNREEIEDLIGFFVNLLALRTDLSGAPSFRELLSRVREVALGAYAHQDLPFDRLVSELKWERGLEPSPLFDVLFVFQNAPAGTLPVPRGTIAPLGVEHRISRFDLGLFMEESGGRLVGRFTYRTDLYEAASVARLAAQLEVLLAGLVEDPERSIDDLEIQTEEERQRQRASREERQRRSFDKFKQVKPRRENGGAGTEAEEVQR